METIVYISCNFQNGLRFEHDLKDNKHDNLHLGIKYARISVFEHYLFLEAHSFPRGSQKTVRLSEQIMPADKYPSIFSRQVGAIVYIYLQAYSRCWILQWNRRQIFPFTRDNYTMPPQDRAMGTIALFWTSC